jgi:hypothetical protein
LYRIFSKKLFFWRKFLLFEAGSNTPPFRAGSVIAGEKYYAKSCLLSNLAAPPAEYPSGSPHEKPGDD